MSKKVKVIIAICIALLGMLIMISKLFDKQPTINTIEQTTLSNEGNTSVSSTNTTTKKKTTKKVVKTTKKVVKQKQVKTAALSEYQQYAKSYGNYDDSQMQCLINLWNRESGWNANSYNKKSGACGIPQALPCSKIKNSEGSNDWKAQIRWGIKYINARYKTPCNAWQHFEKKHWY